MGHEEDAEGNLQKSRDFISSSQCQEAESKRKLPEAWEKACKGVKNYLEC